jgi:homoserine O-acetyltransferase
MVEDVLLYQNTPLLLQLGAKLGPITARVEGFGDRRPDRAVLVAHALTGDAHVASHGPGDRPGWWEAFIGPGRAIDTNEWWVLGINALGGTAGTTGPESLDPEGRRYGRRFPVVTVRDMVTVEAAALEALGVTRPALVIGGSLGGMQALEWGALYGDRVGVVAAVGATASLPALSVGLNQVQRAAVALGLKHGDPAGGMKVARMIAMLSYRSAPHLAIRFGRHWQPGSDPVGPPEAVRFQVESYLDYQGDKLARRFEAETYLRMSRAMDLYDLFGGREGDAGIRAPVRLAGITNDWLFPPEDVRWLHDRLKEAGVDVRYTEISSEVGHDAFLIDTPPMQQWVRGVMADVTARTVRAGFR